LGGATLQGRLLVEAEEGASMKDAHLSISALGALAFAAPLVCLVALFLDETTLGSRFIGKVAGAAVEIRRALRLGLN
jgi:hypothetical protein